MDSLEPQLSLEALFYASQSDFIRKLVDSLVQEAHSTMFSATSNSSGYLALPRPLRRPVTRILILEPGKGDEPLRVSMSTEDVTDPRRLPYEALSYRWSDAMSIFPLYRDKYPMHIHTSLEAALLALRREREWRRLWADAICINQDDEEEKSDQVNIMRHVYAHARGVIVWLGPETVGTRPAFDLARKLGQHRLTLLYKSGDNMKTSPAAGHNTTPESVRHLERPDSLAWDHLADLFANPWWNRVWVIQEVVMAPACIARCGSHEILFSDLVASATYVSYKLGSYYADGTLWFWNDVYLKKFREPVNSPSRLSYTTGSQLSNLLMSTRNFDAGNKRDKVFAIVGMSKEVLTPHELPPVRGTGGHPQSSRLSYADGFLNSPKGRSKELDVIMEMALRPNYKKSVEHVYRDATRFLVLRYHTLHILSEVYHSPDGSTLDDPDYPSWVPVFHRSMESSPFGQAAWYLAGLCDYYRQYVSIDHHYRLYRRTGNMDVLSLDGFKVVRVAKVSQVVRYDKTETLTMDDLWQDIFAEPMLPLDPRDKRKVRQIEDFAAALMAGLPFSRPYPSRDYDIWASLILSGPGDIFERLASVVHAHLRAVYGLAETGSRPEVARLEKPGDERVFQNQIKKTSFSRRAYRAEDGRLGLGPSAMQEGDYVCVLFGGRPLFILRERSEGGWFLIGEAYLHDIKLLTGQVANQVVKSVLRSKVEVFDLY